MPIDLKNLQQLLDSLANLNGSDQLDEVEYSVETGSRGKTVAPAPEKPKRCQQTGCKTKLALSDYACQCKQFYCMKHRYAEAHSCAFDYRAAASKTLEKQNIKVVSDSFQRLS